jgi:hypothetical protein
VVLDQRELMAYVDVGGVPTRRGVFTPPDPPLITGHDIEGITLMSSMNSTAGVNAFRTITGDPSIGSRPLQHARMAIEDFAGDRGMKITYDDKWYESATDNGIAYLPVLPRKVLGATVAFEGRFRSPFVSGKGGKFGPGLGWSNRHRGPASGGSTTQPHAGTGRLMWRDAFRLSPYLYDANGTNGIGMATSPSTVDAGSDYDYHVYEIDIVLNDADTDSGPIPPTGTTYVPPNVVQGVDYQANGIFAVRLDGVTVMNLTNRVHRKYSDTEISHLTWSWFRGGGDPTWDSSSTADNYFDMLWYEVNEL